MYFSLRKSSELAEFVLAFFIHVSYIFKPACEAARAHDYVIQAFVADVSCCRLADDLATPHAADAVLPGRIADEFLGLLAR